MRFYYFCLMFLYTITICHTMEIEVSETQELLSTDEKQQQKLLCYYRNHQYAQASQLLKEYQSSIDNETPYLLYILPSTTNNTILHEIVGLMTSKTFKHLFPAVHSIVRYHPELATQENSESLLPLNYATELSSNHLEALCRVMREPLLHQNPKLYFLSKQTKSPPITIKTAKYINKEQSNAYHNNSLRKAFSLTLFSFSKPIKTSHSSSLITLSRTYTTKN